MIYSIYPQEFLMQLEPPQPQKSNTSTTNKSSESQNSSKSTKSGISGEIKSKTSIKDLKKKRT